MPLSHHNIDVTDYDHIIWDWNGTILDDVTLCIEIVGGMLTAQNLPVPTREEYRSIFGFPIKDYYRALGFDFTRRSFEDLADDYIAIYDQRAHEASLHDSAMSLLGALHDLGKEQSILSAAQQSHVIEVTAKRGLSNYFQHIAGITDHHAASKRQRGLELIEETGIEPARTLMIGDTDHDHEVGTAMGVDVLLVAHGHQNYDRLSAVHHLVIEAL